MRQARTALPSALAWYTQTVDGQHGLNHVSLCVTRLEWRCRQTGGCSNDESRRIQAAIANAMAACEGENM
ncbi:MAG: hypothetical protein ACPIOQ_37025, partial [Promethearchaeia archaeon]